MPQATDHEHHVKAVEVLNAHIGKNQRLGYYICTFEIENESTITLQASHNATPHEVAEMLREVFHNPHYHQVARNVLREVIDELFVENRFKPQGNA